MRNSEKWIKPKLVVIVRRKHWEEALLASCKNSSADATAVSTDQGCKTHQEPEFPCTGPCF